MIPVGCEPLCCAALQGSHQSLALVSVGCSNIGIPRSGFDPPGMEQHHTHKGKSMAKTTPNRWGQLIAVIICQVMIANLQYGWTLFVRPMNQAHGWAIAEIQIAFSIFIALETWLTPLEGWLADKIGPKLVV